MTVAQVQSNLDTETEEDSSQVVRMRKKPQRLVSESEEDYGDGERFVQYVLLTMNVQFN